MGLARAATADAEKSAATKEGAQPAHEVIPLPARMAAMAARDKSGHDTAVLAMGDLLGVVDAFVVTSGASQRQVRSLVEEIERRLKVDADLAPASVEGLQDATWVLLDYGDFIVHVFLDETRAYYDLEHLWSGAPRADWEIDR